MFTNIEDFQKAGKENLENAVKNFGVVAKGMQAIAVEQNDFSKKAFEDSAAQVEKFSSVKTIDAAVEIQTEYVKSTYEAAVAQATKVGEMYVELTKEAYKPFEEFAAKVAK